MNSFTLTAVGNLARNPEAVAKGDITYTRFLLVGNDYAGKDDEGAPREIVTSLWFVAFGALAESLARSARKGDQLIIEARVRASSRADKQGEKQYDHDFVVQGFRFGAPGKIKREERDARLAEGTHRGEDRSNGRAISAAPPVSDGDGSAAGRNTVSHAASARGPRSASGSNGTIGSDRADAVRDNSANAGDSSNASSGARGAKGASDGMGANAGEGATAGSGVNGDNATAGKGANPREAASAGAGANGTNGANNNAGTSASAPAASEKPATGSRSGRRAASPPP
jgi:single-strand DNA-binding protein